MRLPNVRTWISLFFLGALGFATPPGAISQEQVVITLLHTADIHGHVLPTADFEEEPAAHGLARVATLVAAEREQDPDALLLDAGDTIQGAPLELVAHTRLPDSPDPTITAMNLMGYDAMAVGNHEFDFGPERLEAARETAEFPFLSANVIRDRHPVFEPYRVFEVKGVRVGVLGLTTPTIPEWLGEDLIGDLEFVDAVTAAKQWVPRLREEENCDAVIVLTHQGLERNARTGGAAHRTAARRERGVRAGRGSPRHRRHHHGSYAPATTVRPRQRRPADAGRPLGRGARARDASHDARRGRLAARRCARRPGPCHPRDRAEHADPGGD